MVTVKKKGQERDERHIVYDHAKSSDCNHQPYHRLPFTSLLKFVCMKTGQSQVDYDETNDAICCSLS